MGYQIIKGDALEQLRKLPDNSVHCVVTSPPYWGLRDYDTAEWEGGNDPNCTHTNQHGKQGSAGDRAGRTFTGAQNFAKGKCQACGATRIDQQMGLEPTVAEYVVKMVAVFREVRRILRKDGTCWINMGDSYVSTGGVRAHGWQPETNGRGEPNSYPKREGKTIMPMVRNRRRGKDQDPKRRHSAQMAVYRGTTAAGNLKQKDLCGVPWRLAFALQDDGWWLRQDIIWSKPNPTPESVRDRCTKSHEYVFLLSKKARYYYDHEAIKERVTGGAHTRGKGVNPKANSGVGWGYVEKNKPRTKQNPSFSAAVTGLVKKRNKRSIWTVSTQPYSGAHFATFPEALIKPCILAGCPPGGTTLDPFSGTGTVGVVALRYDRSYIGIELSPASIEMSHRRILEDKPLFNGATHDDVPEAEEPAQASFQSI